MKMKFTCPVQVQEHDSPSAGDDPVFYMTRVVIHNITPWYWRLWNKLFPGHAQEFYQFISKDSEQ